MSQTVEFFFKGVTAIAATTFSATAIVFSESAVQAASFVPFSFQTNVTATPSSDPNGVLLNDPTRDVRLDSVVFGGTTINQFEVVTGARILRNDTYTLPDGSVYGVLHSGRGPNTSIDPLVAQGPSKPNPTNQDVIDSLGNLNLNSLLVTRENANSASIEVSFDNPVSLFFFWERGGTPGTTIAGDSDLLVEALSDDRNIVLASYKILRANYTKANYNISTVVEPILNNGPFNIGSIGLLLNEGSTRTLRLTSTGNDLGALNGDNGPDFKVVAAVPEPFTMTGVAVAGGLGWLLKKKKKAAIG